MLLGHGQFGPERHGWQDYKGNHSKTFLYTKYKSSGLCGFSEDFFLCFYYCKSMPANAPQSGAIFYPRNMIGRIYVGYQ